MVTAAKADDTDFDLGLLGLKMQVQSFLLIFFCLWGFLFLYFILDKVVSSVVLCFGKLLFDSPFVVCTMHFDF